MTPKKSPRRAFALGLTALAALTASACASTPRASSPALTNLTKETAMSHRPENAARPVTWFSIPADDIAKSTAFYARAFGWKIEPTTKEEDSRYDYNVVVNAPSDATFTPEAKGRVNGCIVKKAIGLTTPAVLIEVDDLDRAAEAVVAAGGTVVGSKVPMRSLDGEFILVRDPDGNTLELFRPPPRGTAAGAR